MRVKLCEIYNQLDKFDIENYKTILEGKDCIRDYAYILHDKDINDKEAVVAHYHIAIRFNNSYDTKNIAEWFGVAENFVSKIKGRWSDMLKYLIHENAPTKFQYNENEVVSNFDWTVEKDKNGDNRKNEIINDIVEGKIREYNYFEYITPVENVKYKKAITDTFAYRTDKIKGVSREMDVVFITGDSGTGKTTYAKRVAKDKGYSVFVSSGSNDVLDDYKGQDCIILDDLRASSLGLADLLKMLDNHTASTVKSRYKNKVLECKMVIITTTQNIDLFFRNVFADDIETSVQLKRRCETHIRMTVDNIYLKAWQQESRKYSEEFEFPNTILLRYKAKDMTKAEILDKMHSVLGSSLNMVKEVKDNPKEYPKEFEEFEQVGLDEINPFDK